jgi:hypothetical protein
MLADVTGFWKEYAAVHNNKIRIDVQQGKNAGDKDPHSESLIALPGFFCSSCTILVSL